MYICVYGPGGIDESPQEEPNIPYRLARMHPKATRIIADGNFNDDAAEDDKSSCSFRSVNTNADLDRIVKPLIVSESLRGKKKIKQRTLV